jgi:hypothetical protein
VRAVGPRLVPRVATNRRRGTRRGSALIPGLLALLAVLVLIVLVLPVLALLALVLPVLALLTLVLPVLVLALVLPVLVLALPVLTLLALALVLPVLVLLALVLAVLTLLALALVLAVLALLALVLALLTLLVLLVLFHELFGVVFELAHGVSLPVGRLAAAVPRRRWIPSAPMTLRPVPTWNGLTPLIPRSAVYRAACLGFSRAAWIAR